MLRSLVGSEMCIRDSFLPVRGYHPLWPTFPDCSGSYIQATGLVRVRSPLLAESLFCLLYTSDAADEEDSVDLGGRRIIKKKKKKNDSSIMSAYKEKVWMNVMTTKSK
eukprot:TRINITY_DN7410_c0_g1_i9.p2 TRINITY_DN7410_c0_g1~~TRINITY_DN7410_c0_g1_i9.p2  ORF type:complete len:108 (+),score=17.12 TRINITY_DN7410_c0_g1_i9:151-474(+)